MIVNEMAKLVNPDQARERSCRYPSSASCRSSSLASVFLGASGVAIISSSYGGGRLDRQEWCDDPTYVRDDLKASVGCLSTD